jgi:T5SS/PEP-CTERM-associated repeat protein
MKTKSTSQIPRAFSRNAILLAVTGFALCASPGSRGDEVCNPIIHSSWINSGTGDWFDSSNWCGGVPIDHAFTCISNGGTAQITQADPTAKACEAFLGQFACGPGCPNPGNSGNLSVDGGTLDTFSELHIGYGGTGKLTIKNSGVVNTFGADIGAVAGSNGSASVDTNSQWTITGTNGLALGGTINVQGGTGLLSVTNSGKVTAAPVHVWKSGTLTGNGTLSVGSTGTGTATVDGTISRSSGTLTITGNLSLTSSAATQYSVTPQDPLNQAGVSVSGTVSLDGRLLVTMTGTFTPGTQFTLLYAAGGIDPNHPTFSSVSITFPTGQNFTPRVTYPDTNHVYLYLASNTGP